MSKLGEILDRVILIQTQAAATNSECNEIVAILRDLRPMLRNYDDAAERFRDAAGNVMSLADDIEDRISDIRCELSHFED